MIKINIYKLISPENMLNSLLLICNKILDSNEKAIINCESTDKAIEIDEKLWILSGGEFLPHMIADAKEFEEFKMEVPIVLQTGNENTINAKNLIIFSTPNSLDALKKYKKIFFINQDIKDSNDLLLRFWNTLLQENEFEPKYYEQNHHKGWKQLESPGI